MPRYVDGRLVAIRLVAEHPERVQSLILVDGGFPMDPGDPLLRDNLAHDLRNGRVRLSREALQADAGDTFFAALPVRPDHERS